MPAPSRLRDPGSLNESPSKKEGKWVTTTTNPADTPVPQ